jgi:plasmid stability protein
MEQSGKRKTDDCFLVALLVFMALCPLRPALCYLIGLLDPKFGFLHNGSNLEDTMATLNIKNLPDRLYRKIQARANREHRSIAQEVIHILSVATEYASPLSILELQGLGKDVWKKVDAGKHVKTERRDWD